MHKGDIQHLIHTIHQMQLHGVAQIFGNLGDVLFIFLGQNDFEDSRAMGRQKLFFEPADGQHFAAQGDFPSHGNVSSNRNLAQG